MDTHTTSRTTRWAVAATVAASLAAAACSSGSEPAAAATPLARGQVWEVVDAEEASLEAGAIVAFVNGLHVMVLDGDRLYAGTTAFPLVPGTDGARTIALPNGVTADLVRTGDSGELRFSTGERARVRARTGGPQP